MPSALASAREEDIRTPNGYHAARTLKAGWMTRPLADITPPPPPIIWAYTPSDSAALRVPNRSCSHAAHAGMGVKADDAQAECRQINALDDDAFIAAYYTRGEYLMLRRACWHGCARAALYTSHAGIQPSNSAFVSIAAA